MKFISRELRPILITVPDKERISGGFSTSRSGTCRIKVTLKLVDDTQLEVVVSPEVLEVFVDHCVISQRFEVLKDPHKEISLTVLLLPLLKWPLTTVAFGPTTTKRGGGLTQHNIFESTYVLLGYSVVKIVRSFFFGRRCFHEGV